jgi:glycerol-3-phosphate dehydrogenase
MKGDWTASASLPGGDIPSADFENCLRTFKQGHPWISEELARHYCRLYGTSAGLICKGATSPKDLGRHFGGNLYEAEVNYLRLHEWAITAEDVLDRRTKHGLHVTPDQREQLARSLEAGEPMCSDLSH